MRTGKLDTRLHFGALGTEAGGRLSRALEENPWECTIWSALADEFYDNGGTSLFHAYRHVAWLRWHHRRARQMARALMLISDEHSQGKTLRDSIRRVSGVPVADQWPIDVIEGMYQPRANVVHGHWVNPDGMTISWDRTRAGVYPNERYVPTSYRVAVGALFVVRFCDYLRGSVIWSNGSRGFSIRKLIRGQNRRSRIA